MVDKLKEYVLKPYWINLHQLKEVSVNFYTFATKLNIDLTCEEFGLNLLRYYYSTNKQQTLNFIDELILRGFKFFSKKPSPLLPSLAFKEPIKCIFTKEDNNSFQQINFSALGLGNIIERFSINSNKFFDGIPVEAFSYLNKAVNLKLIEIEFLENGFIVSNAKFVDNNKNEDKMDLLISEVFSEGIFNNFRDFCNDKKWFYLSDLKGMDFNLLINIKGFGITRVQKIIKKYQDVTGNCLVHTTSFNRNEKLIDDDILKELIIDDAFGDNQFSIFRNYCIENNINTIADLKKFDFNSLRVVRGLGVTKINSIEKRFEEIVTGSFEIETVNSIMPDEVKSEFNIHNDFLNIDINLIFEDKVLVFFNSLKLRWLQDINSITPCVRMVVMEL